MSPLLPRRSTIPRSKPAQRQKTPPPPKGAHLSLSDKFGLPPRRVPPPKPAPRQVASIIDQSETSLVDVIDNLLNRGVVLNADLILALAEVDLVYVRLSALLCAADRVLPERSR
jgi:hypothetical protein